MHFLLITHLADFFWAQIVEDYGGPSSNLDAPKQIFFCRQVCESGRKAVDTYDLKKRKYLGPTSMDAELALIAANMAHAKQGTLMLDPFAGTGSMMVAAAHYGASTWGGEIHPPILRGKRKGGPNVRSNYVQYGLQHVMPQLVVADFSHSPWASAGGSTAGTGTGGRKRAAGGLFDGIVCDPPYGIREGSRQVNVRAQTEPHDQPQVAAAAAAEGGEVVAASASDTGGVSGGKRERLAVVDALASLLDFAASSLVVGGRLVYWLPTTMDYLPEDCPRHHALQEVHNSGQTLSLTLQRRLITMVKTQEPDPNHIDQDQAMTAAAAAGAGAGAGAEAAAAGGSVEDAGSGSVRVPAHHNLSAKVFRQAGREEDRFLNTRN